MRLSLRNKFLIPTLILIVIGMATVAALSFQNTNDAVAEARNQQFQQIAETTSVQIQQWLAGLRRDLSLWSSEAMYRTAAGGAEMAQNLVSKRLSEVVKAYQYFELVVLADAKGMCVASSNRAVVGKVSVADRGYFQAAMRGKVSISPAIKSKSSGNPVIAVAAPVIQNDEPIGVLVGVVDLGYFTKSFVDSIKVGKTGYVYLADQSGVLLAHPNKELILQGNISSTEHGKQMLASQGGSLTHEENDEERTVSFKKVPGSNWLVAVTISSDELLASARRAGLINLAVAVVVIIIAALIIFLVARSVVNPINVIITRLNRGAQTMSASSDEVASSSQSLAEGASEQAASLEETSSSLEEMASMTRQNSDHAHQADALMKDTGTVVTKANASMKDLKAAMERINAASDETAKIIKTIDEIAFQTNLLALNAAVEAARAGEAGAGFAVVADEVRNLAMRAAEAAKSTTALIEENLANINRGSQLVASTDQDFDRVEGSSLEVAKLVAEIAAATNEQAQGIDQLNQATNQMDQVTQRVAAGAEESAATSEELREQTHQLHEIVEELAGLVGTGMEEGQAAGDGGRGEGPDRRVRGLLPWKRS